MKTAPIPADPERPHVKRFDRYDRALHGMLMSSFLFLALSGLPLLFADRPWASVVATFMGGYGVTGVIHRLAALLLLTCFTLHLVRISVRIFVKKESGLLWGSKSLVPQPRDAIQLLQHVRWFVGLGPRPRFDRFTYWEKFDYWAVFWGMGIIGTSGLFMWFPTFFARFVPGWVLNVSLLVHGEEALLAMVFIFTVHFFNGHIRPEKFPMDTVIFTGRVTEDELRLERPAEYERVVRTGELEALRIKATPPWVLILGRTIGTTAIVLGLIVVCLSVWALLD